MSITIATPEQLQELLKPIEYELQELKEKFTLKEPEDWLTREQTATLLQIAYPTLHEWCNKGILKHYKIGNRTYFSRKEINEVLYNSNK
ncbi:helix-turn-helix domain-containing protein [Aequorivita sp. KMM 9714]|uniref:helix-turn-helix domain-containing protein n=1 Tax=Aequorivita sp. KMM 9714 TaxID=2707173 RepID=UPI0013ED0943|nr:helix-turn-helix domain-containing protein [Aequorivita sp. KMM 9714]NGX83110.1 helix-turn-helix domain-containing protein [Aequorivita sp. KMM 9714]